MYYTIIASILLVLGVFFIISGVIGMVKYQNFLLNTQGICLIVIIGQTLLMLATLVYLHFSALACKILLIILLNVISYLAIVHLLLKKYALKHKLLTNLQELHD